MTTPPITACVWRIGSRSQPQIEVHEAQGLPVGTIRYAVRHMGNTLNKEGKWEYEPMPSSRDADYLDRCRWDDWEDATRAAIRAYERLPRGPVGDIPWP